MGRPSVLNEGFVNLPLDRGGPDAPPRPAWTGSLHAVRSGVTTVEKITGISDGTSNTLLIGEYTTKTHPARRTFWAYSYTSYNQSSAVPPQTRQFLNDFDACVNIGGAGDNNPCKRAWASMHPGIVNFLLCDGSVRAISRNIDTFLFADLTTIAGGEVVSEF